MTKILLLALALLVPAAGLQSQDTARPGSSDAGTAASDQITAEGCLQGTGGDYILNGKSGRTYQLQGDTSSLDAYVGHEVQITGPTSGASTYIPSMATDADGNVVRPTLSVEQVKSVAEKCNASRQ